MIFPEQITYKEQCISYFFQYEKLNDTYIIVTININ